MFVENRINEAINKLNDNEKYELMEKLEVKNLGDNENADMDFIESIVNLLLEGTTIIAKLFRIVD